MRDLLISTRDAAARSGPPANGALVGFDGFIDTIVRAVDKRIDFDQFTPIETMTAFGERIVRAAGLSTNIEFVPTTVKLGGNGPIMTKALSAAGLKVTYIGMVGDGAVHPVFQDMTSGSVYPIASPGLTDALEFSDGKVMLGKTETTKDVTWQAITESVGLEAFKGLLGEVDLVAFVNWTMLPYMTDIWQTIATTVLPTLPVRANKPWFFVDLADPEKRHNAEIAAALEQLKAFKSHFRTVLGLNRKEATEVANALGLDLGKPAAEAELSEIVPAIAERIELDGLVVHPTDRAAALFDGEYSEIIGPHTSKPFLTTGAGDNFNAGFCTGLTIGLTPKQSLVLGKATSGFYVRKGHSPSWDELTGFIETWSENVGQDF